MTMIRKGKTGGERYSHSPPLVVVEVQIFGDDALVKLPAVY